jgi:hypothetical protein
MLASVDYCGQHPNPCLGAEQVPRRSRFLVAGVRATVLTHTGSETGQASGHHAIVYWRIAKTAYLASVHAQFDGRFQSRRYTPIAKAIARGLINQMVGCSTDPGSAQCGLVFPPR